MRRAWFVGVVAPFVGCGVVESNRIENGGHPDLADATPSDAATPNAAAPDSSAGCFALVPPVPTSNVDVELVVDRSIAGNDAGPEAGANFWQATLMAVATFVTEEYVPNVDAGLLLTPPAGAADACNAEYDVPDVEIGTLEQNGGKIVAALNAAAPGGERPLGPALVGAIAHMQGWAGDHPAREPAVVLLTRGDANECTSTSPADAAAVGFGMEPPIRTYVIDLGPPNSNLDAIANAGGSDHAFTITGGDVEHAFLDAMFTVAGLNPGCTFRVPRSDDGLALDPNLIAFKYTHSGTPTWLEPARVGDMAACPPNGGDGWYYSDPSSPDEIALCPVTCTNMPNSQAEIVYGCPPKLGREL